MLRRRLLSIIPVAVLLASLPIAASALNAKPAPPGLVMLEDLGDIVRWEAVVDGRPLRITTRMFDGCLWSCHPTAAGCWVAPHWLDATTHEESAIRGAEFIGEILGRPECIAVLPRLGSTDFDERLYLWRSAFAGRPETERVHRQVLADAGLIARNPDLHASMLKTLQRSASYELTATIDR
jgi:hypothetical protein